jgi:hypothetical protein
MSQVLEASEPQDQERTSITINYGYATMPRSVMSALTKTKPQHLPEYAATTEQHRETAFDHVCRTNPFLLAFSC